ncbi:ABC transporter permease [Lysinibacillus telephonicus]|uniref:ABC transporter permease n=1 Tax=Lysinibacillus telephonicus TaxID=1714840 RepID=A0A3S0JR33_9BACI|nr:ABC transporter permease [Lysinibacillus telephonicus]RTQ89253.1 ABC transporter permease [Lysinibacillus telephonicus]
MNVNQVDKITEPSAAKSNQKRNLNSTKLNLTIKKYIPIISFFVLWECLTRLNITFELVNSNFFPPPSIIAVQGWQLIQTGVLTDSIISSTIRVFVGTVIGILAGVVLALIIGKSKLIDYWASPILNMLGPIPSLAILPLFIIWFGIGEIPKIILIAWTVFFPVLTNTIEGIKSVRPVLIRSALSLGASDQQIYKKVILPSVLPNILAGCQISLGLAFSALVVSEMMGATSGLGYIIVDARNYFKLSNMYVAIIVIGIEYSLFSYTLKLVERKMLSWRKGGFADAIEK